MKKLLASVPLPIAGVMLSFATLGNIFANILPSLRPVCGGISALLGIIILLRWLFCFKKCCEDLTNPVVASTFCTFDMGLMVLSTYVVSFSSAIAHGMWFIGLGIHFLLVIYILVKFILPFQLEKILPAHFIPFVGYVVASVTAPAVGLIPLGQVIFYVGLVCYLVLLIAVGNRLWKHPLNLTPLKPLKVIVAAPGSLCLAGYLSSFQAPKAQLVYFLEVIAVSMTMIGIYYLLVSLKKDFFPSYAAYTFPMVISTLAQFRFANYLANRGIGFASFFKGLAYVEFTIAIVVCLYVLFRYLAFIVGENTKVATISES